MTDNFSANAGIKLLRNFCALIDAGVYTLLGFMYEIFFNVASADLFANDTILGFYKRVQLIIGVYMVFQLAILIMKGIFNTDQVSGKNNKKQNNGTDVSQWNEGYNQTQNCTGDNSILGNVNDPNSVAWLLQQVLNYIKIIGPLLVVVLSSVEFAKVIINSDDEAMAKAQKKLITRIILAACLFFIPTLVQAALDLFGFTSDATCGIE